METTSDGRSTDDWRELIAIVLLSVTAIVTAWTGFQASKWGGAMSISFSQASSARIEAARLDAVANRRVTVQVQLFTQWLQAYQDRDQQLADFLEQRFPEPLATTFPLWLASRPLQNSQAPASPFEMAEYVVPELEQAKAADARADASFATALRNNQRGDDYTALTIAFATVLFFAALSGRLRRPRDGWILLGLGIAEFLVLVVIVATFPKLV
jgi:hypothetical protein